MSLNILVDVILSLFMLTAFRCCFYFGKIVGDQNDRNFKVRQITVWVHSPVTEWQTMGQFCFVICSSLFQFFSANVLCNSDLSF